MAGYRPVRILVFHGYLLRGTGSNVYNARLAVALAEAGHEVHVLCQEHRPEEVEGLPHPRVHVHRPDIGGLLPVYVQDEYEGFRVRRFAELSDEELDRYVEANVEAVRSVAAAVRPELALANHAVMGPAILSRGLGDAVPYAVKIHGSALEYTVRPEPVRFAPYAREGLDGARSILVGSRHTAESLFEVLGDDLRDKTFLGPPGVDTETFRPRDRAAAWDEVRALADRMRGSGVEGVGSFARDRDAIAARLGALDPSDRHVLYVGKLIVSKGVDLLAAAWPLVEGRHLVVVGFGAYRAGFERLIAALDAGDRDEVERLARRGRAEEGGPQDELRHLLDFLDTTDDAYWAAARGVASRITVVGRLEHRELAPLVSLSEAQVVTSTFPEAFGMVAAEAAAAGAVPVVADHSGLGEVADVLGPAARRYPKHDVRALAAAVRDATADSGLVATARARFGWDAVARGVVAAARGDHAALAQVPQKVT